MTAGRNDRDRSVQALVPEGLPYHPAGDDAAPLISLPLPAEKTLLQLSAELKNLIRGDRIFRAGAKR
ncbi:MAG: hypothetical protein RLO05_12050 [Rhodospirillales bacterium]|tara:strand:+ start:1219 stop:1419 length:201 start_codon:yes stop_codon:yes gene_type:complete